MAALRNGTYVNGDPINLTSHPVLVSPTPCGPQKIHPINGNIPSPASQKNGLVNGVAHNSRIVNGSPPLARLLKLL